MWYLTSESDQRVIYIFPQKAEVIIGRSPDKQICDFAIQDDASISRKHVALTLNDNGLFVKDLGSRYGTFINKEPVSANTTIKLHDKSVIKLGKMKSIWTVHEAKHVTCTSTLKGENLQNLKVTLSKIGAVLKNDWDNTCKYLTMPAITLTIKVVLALVQGSYIVTTQFWNKCLEAIENNTVLPDPKDFRPDVVESTLNKNSVSFMPDKRRATLFAGKKFIFFSKRQYDMYKLVLVNSGATPLLLSECKFSKSMLCEDDVIVIQYNFTSQSQETETQKNQIIEIVNHLKTNGKRVVADPEIGLAILHCSTARNCNPNFNFSTEVIKQVPVPQSTKVLAQETQEQTGISTKRENVIINESLLTNDNSVNEGTSKRKLDGDVETNANKKFASNSETKNIDINQSNKRKHEEEENSQPNKKMAIDDENEFFNFVTPQSTNKSSTQPDKLNLAKPQKRKADFDDDDEDDLFNFVQEKISKNIESSSIFEDNVKDTESIANKITTEDINAMRGSKLDELKNIEWNKNKKIKKENEDLDEKMNQLDIGEVVVTIKESLIVKKEPIHIEAQETPLKNFKKFKKVWPVKMQLTIVPKSTMSVTQNHEMNENSLSNENTV